MIMYDSILLNFHAGNYRQGPHRYLYREKLLRMHRRTAGDENTLTAAQGSKLEVDLAHVGEYDTALLGLLLNQPADVIPPLEHAAADALRTLLYDLQSARSGTNGDEGGDAIFTQEGDNPTADNAQDNPSSLEGVTSIQILLKGNMAPTPLRSIKSEHMNRLLKCPGIVISTSPVRSRATQLLLRCSRCLHKTTVYATNGPFGSVQLPRKCAQNPQDCGEHPYGIVPDESHFVDRQTLKLQESPERVPTGEMPRSVLLAVERSLVDRAPPGTRVQVLCIPTLFSSGGGNKNDNSVKQVYLRVVGLQRDHAPGESATFAPREEEAFRLLSKRADVYQILSRSIAPSISGDYTVDIKKAITCMLFGGTRKHLPDGVRLRGDINVLMLVSAVYA
jgi:DNA replication licensing factor MCM5